MQITKRFVAAKIFIKNIAAGHNSGNIWFGMPVQMLPRIIKDESPLNHHPNYQQKPLAVD
jgi:hypothetical protein